MLICKVVKELLCIAASLRLQCSAIFGGLYRASLSIPCNDEFKFLYLYIYPFSHLMHIASHFSMTLSVY
jgi:hypothetical protein